MKDQVADEIKVQNMLKILRIALFALMGCGVGVLVYYFVDRQRQSRAEEAFADLFQAEKLEDSVATTLSKSKTGEQEIPTQEIVEGMLKWPDDKKADYVSKLQKVIQKHPQSVAADLAALTLGRWYFFQAKYTEAASVYRDLIQRISQSSSEHSLYLAMAYGALGSTLESLKNYPEAQKAYADALALKSNPLKPIAYLGEARTLKSLGQADKSKEFYQKLISEFPNTDYEKRARALLALVDHK